MRARLAKKELNETDRLIKHRQQAIAEYLSSHQLHKLQIGAGENPLPGWLNTDIEPNTPGVLYVNASERFPFADCTFDYVFSEHMLEHVSYQQGCFMLNEIFRVLRAGGRVRIATPDMVQFMELLADNKTDLQKVYLEWHSKQVMGLYSPGTSRLQMLRPEWDIDYQHILKYYPDARLDTAGFVVNNMFRSYGHQFLYDAVTLRAALTSAGFDEIVQLAPDVSLDENLRGIDAHERMIGVEMNRLETMVFEARRPLGT
jgi:predicted SAM-dependent methyltransferase